MGTDIPAYRESYRVQATSLVGDSGISPEEATAQVAGYLGYLATLVVAGAEENQGEIARVYKIIQGYISQGKISPTSSIGKLIHKLVGILAPGGKLSHTSESAFADAYEGYGGSPAILEINKWFQDGGFDFKAETSPDTAFAYLMFMVSAVEQLSNGPEKSEGLESVVKGFFGQGGFPSGAEISSEFLAAYLKTEPGMKAKIDDIFSSVFTLLPNPPEEFKEFYDIFNGTGPYSYQGLPAGMTPEGIMIYFKNYIPGEALPPEA